MDTETGAVVVVTLQLAHAGDTSTVRATLVEALENVETISQRSNSTNAASLTPHR